MKVVIDTNVIVSGLLNPYGAPGEVIRMLVSGALEICYDARILSEYREVLNRSKFRFDKNDIEDVLKYIEHSGCSVAAGLVEYKASDINDQMFLEAAVCCNAQYLITGNKADFPPHVKGLTIISPKGFMDKHR